MDDKDVKYYYNLTTGEVEVGRVSDWTERMGPYDTYEEATHAMEKVRERNRAWDDEDREWNGASED